MNPRPFISASICFLLLTLVVRASGADGYWPQWRGPSATGVSTTAQPPLEWSESKNVRWKVEVPGRGSSTPIVWKDRIFLLTAVPAGARGGDSHAPKGRLEREAHEFRVLAFDRRSGRVLWSQLARQELPHETTQENGTFASSSAITDGELVIASFESRGIYAYDINGGLLWGKDLGDKRMRSEFGEGSTPVLHGDRLVVVWDHQGESFIVALDKRTGKELWRQPRDEVDSWATPLIVEADGRTQVITTAMKRIRSYDLATGKLLWHAAGTTMNPIPSPVFGHGIVIATSGFRGNNLKAIRVEGARGDLDGTPAIIWTMERDTPYVPSPLLYGDILYLLKSNVGILSALDVRTGKPHYQLQRLDKTPNVFSSPVGAAGRVYIAGRDGTTLVLRHGPTFEVLAENTLDDGFDASPALVDRELFLRGYRYLYCIAE